MTTEFVVTVTEHTLPNGLKVLLVPAHHAPVVSVWAFYRVGSRHEQIGITGISHWVEHMLFKGTPQFPKGQIARLIQKHGGTLNGHTTYDHTATLTGASRANRPTRSLTTSRRTFCSSLTRATKLSRNLGRCMKAR